MIENQAYALLNGVMDAFADLMAYVDVTLVDATGPEVERLRERFWEASAEVQEVVPAGRYGPGKAGLATARKIREAQQ